MSALCGVIDAASSPGSAGLGALIPSTEMRGRADKSKQRSGKAGPINQDRSSVNAALMNTHCVE